MHWPFDMKDAEAYMAVVAMRLGALDDWLETSVNTDSGLQAKHWRENSLMLTVGARIQPLGLIADF
jgi:hypothetical protein